MTKFAERLNELRIEKGLNLKQLGEKVGISDVALGRWEKGTRIPNIESAAKLAKFFNVSTDYLIGVE